MISFPAFCETRGYIAIFKGPVTRSFTEPNDVNPNFRKDPNINVKLLIL